MVESAAIRVIEATLADVRTRVGDAATRALYPGLLVPPGTAAEGRAWLPATRLTDGTAVPALIDAAKQRWSAQPSAAAALAWKSYAYWLALPAVAGFATNRRIALPRPEDVLVDFHDREPFVVFGLRRAAVAVLPSDPLAAAATPGIQVVRDGAALHDALREALLDAHLDPLLEQIRARVHLGRRTLLGSVASGAAYGVRLALMHTGATPESVIETTRTLLAALGVDDLVELIPTAGPAGVHIQRRTCCLAFTLPEPKICSGCCLRPPPTSRG